MKKGVFFILLFFTFNGAFSQRQTQKLYSRDLAFDRADFPQLSREMEPLVVYDYYAARCRGSVRLSQLIFDWNGFNYTVEYKILISAKGYSGNRNHFDKLKYVENIPAMSLGRIELNEDLVKNFNNVLKQVVAYDPKESVDYYISGSFIHVNNQYYMLDEFDLYSMFYGRINHQLDELGKKFFENDPLEAYHYFYEKNPLYFSDETSFKKSAYGTRLLKISFGEYGNELSGYMFNTTKYEGINTGIRTCGISNLPNEWRKNSIADWVNILDTLKLYESDNVTTDTTLFQTMCKNYAGVVPFSKISIEDQLKKEGEIWILESRGTYYWQWNPDLFDQVQSYFYIYLPDAKSSFNKLYPVESTRYTFTKKKYRVFITPSF